MEAMNASSAGPIALAVFLALGSSIFHGEIVVNRRHVPCAWSRWSAPRAVYLAAPRLASIAPPNGAVARCGRSCSKPSSFSGHSASEMDVAIYLP